MSKFKSTWFYASLASYEVKKGLFVKKKEKQHSERYVDFDEYADRLRNAYEELDSDGYDVVSVTPINMGQSEQSIAKTKQFIPQSNYLGDVGFSITRGAVVIAKKRDS